MKLQDRVAIVTGAAQDIGAACVRAFAAEGARVVASDVNEIGGAALVKDVAARGGTALFCRADVSVRTDAERLVRFATDHFGRLDIMVSNAGIVHAADFIDLTEEDFDRVLRVNLKGAFLCGQAAARQMDAGAAGARPARRRCCARRDPPYVERQRRAGDRQSGAVHGQQGRAEPVDQGDGDRTGAAGHPRDGHRPGLDRHRAAEISRTRSARR